MRRLVDCGFIIGVLDLDDDGSPTLTLMHPETEDGDAKSIVVWQLDGLHNLRDALAEYLDAHAERLVGEERRLAAEGLTRPAGEE